MFCDMGPDFGDSGGLFGCVIIFLKEYQFNWYIFTFIFFLDNFFFNFNQLYLFKFQVKRFKVNEISL